ncbi:hypothetical protein PMAYCL1PPCAC_02241 [Pristionchus mayeri]|uniref:JmjC domain-containing protein n=1 Tax=Pristionchus mayeri TaxID=1317129 RepID=A0AAN5C884_9BILA|nr:hypothetical protein PMAYCL1PPCAC_02241 [Pristionchus mayeri]
MEPMEDDEGVSLNQIDIGQISLMPKFRSIHEVVPSLTLYERLRLDTLTSLNFIEFQVPSIALHPERALLFKGFRILEKRIEQLVIHGHIEEEDKIDAFLVYLKLGHICLLAGDYARALSAYQQAHNLGEEHFWKDSGAYYGLGIVYLHFKAYWCAIEAFNRYLYTNPTSSIASEVNARLGVCYKAVKLFPDALRHFHAALNDHRSQQTFLTVPQLKLNIALTHDSAGDIDKAYKECSQLLSETAATGEPYLRAAIERELGWLCYRAVDADICQTMEERRSKLMEAEQHLQESKQLQPESGKTHYYLGRCYGEQTPTKAHDAFLNYRASIDKSESDSDTWCSIGVLYHQQNQPMDALQAFVCAVDLDPEHSAAWTNLGNLYENHNRFADALSCYKKAIKFNPTTPESIKARIIVLERELTTSPALINTSPRQGPFLQNSRLPALKEAGNQPIPSELRQRQEEQVKMKQASYRNGSPVWKMGELALETTMPPTERRSGPLNSSEMHMLSITEEMDEDVLQREGVLAHHTKLVEQLKEHGHVEGCDTPFDSRSIKPSNNSADDDEPKEMQSVFVPRRSTRKRTKTPKREASEEAPSAKRRKKTLEELASALPKTFAISAPLNVPLDTTGDELIAKCTNRNTKLFKAIFGEESPPPTLPKPKTRDPEEKLKRPTPVINIETRKDVMSLELQKFCEGSPIALIHGLTTQLRMDLSLFSTKHMMEYFPMEQIEIRDQLKMDPDVNVTVNGEPTWECTSEKKWSTIGDYGAYQISHFKASLKEDSEKVRAEKNNKYGGDSQAKRRRTQNAIPDETRQFQVIKFGTNIDLSDDVKYKRQLTELAKMPPFCRIIAGCNLLSHLGHTVLGMNSAQMYMKVPGNRTTAHVENNCLASVNINVGPGDCEWFGVPYEYWSAVNELCTKEGVNFLKNPWWPNFQQLINEGIPVYRFTQKAGDLVWVGPGCIHWVQATGYCNNVAWNVGPISYNQLAMAAHQYEWNKLQKYTSLVPMQHLFWQLAKNVRVTQPRVYMLIRGMLIRSLCYAKFVATWAESKLHMSIMSQPKKQGDGALYCKDCLVEVWNVIFARELKEKFQVYCAHCVLKHKDENGIHVIQQIPFPELVTIYNDFQLHMINKPPVLA